MKIVSLPAFIAELDHAIDFHRNNQNDAHNVSQAVAVALTEVKDAFRRAWEKSPEHEDVIDSLEAAITDLKNRKAEK